MVALKKIAVLEEQIEQKKREFEGFEKRESERVAEELKVMTEKLASMKTQLEESTRNLRICELLEERVKQLQLKSSTGNEIEIKSEFCLLCQTNPANVVLVPCGHSFLCHANGC